MTNYAKNVKSSSLFTAENAKRALLAYIWKLTLTRLQGKTRSLYASALEFLFTAAGVDPGKHVELSVVLAVFFLIVTVIFWSILCSLSDLAGIV